MTQERSRHLDCFTIHAEHKIYSWFVAAAKPCAFLCGSGCDNQANNQAIQAKGLRKDEDEDHAHKQTRLLCVGTDTRITHNANGETSGQRAHANGQACTEMCVTRVGRVQVGLVEFSVDDDCCDEAVDTKHTSHNN